MHRNLTIEIDAEDGKITYWIATTAENGNVVRLASGEVSHASTLNQIIAGIIERTL